MASPYMGELRIMAFAFPPKGWALCNGQQMPINSNQALFALLGTTYGGNGQTTFCLPDLRTRAPAHVGAGPTQTLTLGEVLGEYTHTLLTSEMPKHIHFLSADANTPATSNSATPATGNSFGQTIGKPNTGNDFDFFMYSSTMTNQVSQSTAALALAGGSQPHENRQPYLVLNICICLQGIFPSQN